MEVKEKLSRSHLVLLFLVSTASFFEGYDFIILSLVQLNAQNDWGISTQQWGIAGSLINIGTIVAFFVLRLGDYIGRRSMLLWTVLGYTLATAATAFSQGVYAFVILQFLARVFLVAEWGISTVIIAEEFPATKRGIGIAIVSGIAGVGAIVGSAVFPMLSRLNFGWKTAYLVGIIPLVVVFFIRRGVLETKRFASIREVHADKPHFTEILHKPTRRNFVLIALLWFFMYLGYTPLLFFYKGFAVSERGLTEGQVSLLISVAFVVGLSGYIAVGKLMDLWGRRPTAILFFGLGAVATFAAFTVQGIVVMGIALVVLIFFATSYLTICATYTAELFPTRLRASASAWTNNTLGRVGMVFAPTLVVLLAALLGGNEANPRIGESISIMGLFPLLCALIVLFFLPETKSRELEDINGDRIPGAKGVGKAAS